MTKKGYGSHYFLNEYIEDNPVRRLMEIGVAYGDNARSMVQAAKNNYPTKEIEYYGFDSFNSENQLAEVEEKLSQTGCRFELFEGDSVKVLPKVVGELPIMDLIFIDGGHSFGVVKSDWENSKKVVDEDTGIFFHNYDYSGVKRVVQNISEEEYRVNIIDPPGDYRSVFVEKQKKN